MVRAWALRALIVWGFAIPSGDPILVAHYREGGFHEPTERASIFNIPDQPRPDRIIASCAFIQESLVTHSMLRRERVEGESNRVEWGCLAWPNCQGSAGIPFNPLPIVSSGYCRLAAGGARQVVKSVRFRKLVDQGSFVAVTFPSSKAKNYSGLQIFHDSWRDTVISEAEYKTQPLPAFTPSFKIVRDELEEDVRPTERSNGNLARVLLNAGLSPGNADLHSSKNGEDQSEKRLSQTSERLDGAGIAIKEGRQNLYHVGLLFAVMFASVPIGIGLSYRAVVCWARCQYVVSTALFIVALVVMAGAVTGLWTVLLIDAVSGRQVAGIAL